MPHPKTVEGFDGTLDDLAREIENMDYASVKDLIRKLAECFIVRADADKDNGKPKLATELYSVAGELKQASFYAGRAAEICKKYNEKEQGK